MKHWRLWAWGMCILGLSVLPPVPGKQSFQKITTAHLKTQSTGTASLSYDSTAAAEFVAHRLSGVSFDNGLYQAFLAIHIDQIDSALTFHSRAGRTTSGAGYPGDLNTFTAPTGSGFAGGDSIDQYQLRFGIPNLTDRFVIKQIVTARRDSVNRIAMDLVVEFFKRAPGDTTTFSGVRLLLGYDGDIGTSTGGYADDSTGFYRDDSVAIAYVYDGKAPRYTGVAVTQSRPNDSSGSFPVFHQTINGDGYNRARLDTLLYQWMMDPQRSAEAQNTDVTVYWRFDLGAIVPTDTVRDTIHLAFVNGQTLDGLVAAAHGQRVLIAQDLGSHPADTETAHAVLYQNYPNPFNPGTVIRYELQRDETVRLDVFNVLGQRIVTLVSRQQPRGAYAVTWNGRNDAGGLAASGLYFYRLSTSEGRIIRKMVLVK